MRTPKSLKGKQKLKQVYLCSIYPTSKTEGGQANDSRERLSYYTT